MRFTSEDQSMSMSAINLAVENFPQPSADARTSQPDVLRGAMSEFEKPLLGYAHSLLSDWELARDVVQETFVKLHRELKTNQPENLKAWLFTVCRNRSLDILRKNKRITITDTGVLESFGDEAQPSPSKLAERQDAHSRALEFLDRLPANQQEVIRLKFQADLSYKEISELTKLTVGNVGYLLHHGLKRLRELMTET
ncbi:MAG: sigma-70 family RNA polymerase sigma factor [Verrucomicrobiota bacterium]